jgi:asparagine synthase (glutamine-hydrolysing)
MCGITGWINYLKDLQSEIPVIQAMTKTLKHRGPDAEGYFVKQHVLLGHQRLAIIDLTGGNQPMTRGDYTVVYNGEIYNANEIREQLVTFGHQFQTTSDTEVLLVAYIQWKEQCVDYLNGIYAFAIWNENEESLFLCRDRLGVKPLFYSHLGQGNIVFSSEIKGILAHPAVKPCMDYDGLAALFSLGPSRKLGHAIFKGIEELKPAHAMLVKKHEQKIWRYWDIESREHTDTLEETRAQVRVLVENAVIRQLISDVPLCTMLSGGLDSSIITAIAAKQLSYSDKTLATFSVSYEDNDAYFKGNAFQTTQDGYWIEQMQQQYKTNHRTVSLTQENLVEALEQAMWLRDMPSMADIDSSLYLFCKEMKSGFSVGLSGECADEVFGGYPWFYQQQASGFPWLRSTSERESFLRPIWQQRLQLPAYLQETYEEAIREMPAFIGNEEEQQRQQLFYLNNQFFMQTLLERNDRMTMGASMEVRVPFADHTIVEYVWNIPWAMKNSGGMEKGILREAFEDMLPNEVVYRKKNPYPKTYHPQYTALVQQQLQQMLSNKSSVLHELFDKESLQQLIISGGKSFQVPWFGQLMAGPQLLAYLIQLHLWVENYNIDIISA